MPHASTSAPAPVIEDREGDLDTLARAVQRLRAPHVRLVLARDEARREGPRTGASLTTPQHLTLSTLRDGPLAMSELAGATGVAVSTATRMVQGLRRLGLVAPVEVEGGDARRRYVAITAAGREAAERESAAQLAPVREVLRRLDPSRRRAVLEGMRALTDALREIEGERGTCDAAGPHEGGLRDA